MLPTHLGRAWGAAALVVPAGAAAQGSTQRPTPPPRPQAPESAAASTTASPLDSLVRLAEAASAAIRAATARIAAAEHRVAPAGAWPDPVLMAGIQNLPLGKEQQSMSSRGVPTGSGGPDPMTMRMVGVSQTVPYPGKLGLARRAAEREADAARAERASLRLDIARQVKAAYYERAFLDRALEVVDRNRALLTQVIRVAEAHYGAGASAPAGPSRGGSSMGGRMLDHAA